MKKGNILFLNRHEIQIDKYDQCISESRNSLPYAFSFYLDALCKDWSVLILDDYSIVMPLPIRIKYGVKYIYPPFFIQQLGLFSSQEIDIEILCAFIEHIPDNIRYIQTNFNYKNPIIKGAVKKTNLVLSLNSPYETIIKAYSKMLQRNINKTLSTTFNFEASNERDKFLAFYETHTLSKTREIKNADIAKLSRLVDVLFEKNMARIFVLKSGSLWLSATLFLITKHRIVNLLVANSDASKQTNSSAILLDQVIRLYAGENKMLDFEGSELDGVARFYRNFGAEEQSYFQYTENKLPKIFRWLKS